MTHEEVMGKLPPDATIREGQNAEWWCGSSKASLEHVFEKKEFMKEAHVHGFANRLGQTIVTIDEQQEALVMYEYAPGYGAQTQLTMRDARERRKQEEQPIWLLMSPNHWSALLPKSIT